MLAWTIYISFLGAGLLMLLPRDNVRLARGIAMAITIAGAVFAFGGAFRYAASDGVVTVVRAAWIPWLGIDFHLAADGISITLVILTGLAAMSGVLFSWNIQVRTREFFAFYLTLIGAVYGVFLSFDLFLFLVFYELAIIPKYFLIAIWGSTRREYGAMKLTLYSFLGGAMVILGLLATVVLAGVQTGELSFDLIALSKVVYPEQFQKWAFPLVFLGFAILAGIWPLHTWAPTGHVAAPTAASMLLAGVVMKLGAYGALRVAMTLFPVGFQMWQNTVAVLAVVGIVYAALVALVQQDLKFVIGYSSVSHMGFVLLGLATMNEIGVSGAVLQMFSHGVIAGLLFAVVGRMVYDRAHTRQLGELEAMKLSRALPFAAVTFVIASVASVGFPGFSGFVAELQVLIGTWQDMPVAGILAGVGIVLGVAYTLRAVQRAFFGDSGAGALQGDEPVAALPPITVPERIGAGILVMSTLVIGLYPRLLLDLILPSVRPVVDALQRGGAP